MDILLTLAALVALAVAFVLQQHGTANTLISIGTAFIRAGKRRNSRIARRQADVNQQMVAELEA